MSLQKAHLYLYCVWGTVQCVEEPWNCRVGVHVRYTCLAVLGPLQPALGQMGDPWFADRLPCTCVCLLPRLPAPLPHQMLTSAISSELTPQVSSVPLL